MKTITVIPNPYIALDKDGVPQGVVGAGMPGVFVGAQIDIVASRASGKNRYFYPPNRDGSLTRKVVFSAEVAHAVAAGELLAATAADAALCGITEKEYLEPKRALEAEAEKALAYYRSVKGKDAKLADVPREATPEPAEGLPAETASVQLTPNLKMKKEKEG